MAPPNVKIKHITRSPSSSGDTRFPKLDECAHFHYENVELGPIKVLLCDKQIDSSKSSVVCSSSANKENENDHLCFLVTVISNNRKWMVRRSYKNFMFLDTQLHRCVYDRKYSLLRELPNLCQEDSESEDFEEKIRTLLSEYLERFSQLAGSLINC
ncbi:Rho GTPase-activating protein 32, partial [Stegodyphus mimosarum]